MSLPAKYQKNIIDKIINDFPELIFDKNNDARKYLDSNSKLTKFVGLNL